MTATKWKVTWKGNSWTFDDYGDALRKAGTLSRGAGHKLIKPVYPRKKKARENPRPVLIYGRVLRVEAQKTQEHICDAGCKRSGHRYFHNFKPGVLMYGLPNKDLLLTKRKH